MPAVVVAAIAGTSIIGALASSIFGVLFNVVLGQIGTALFGKPKKPKAGASPVSNITSTVRSASEPQRLIYGQRLVAGVLAFVATARVVSESVPGPGDARQPTIKDLHLVLLLARGQLTEIGDVYFNDVISSDARFNDAFGPAYRLTRYLGSVNQNADPGLIAAVPTQWTSAHRLRGLAYLYAVLTWIRQPQVWATGIPNIKCLVRGYALYDTRNGLTRYSRNPALVLLHYMILAREVGGFGADVGDIDLDYVSAAAAACDEIVDIGIEAGSIVHGIYTATNEVELSNNLQGYSLGDRLFMHSTGAMPAPLVDGTEYWWTPTTGQDPNKLQRGKLSTTYANALAEIYIDLTTEGTGTRAVRRTGQVRYTCDAVVQLDRDPVDIVESMLSSMAGTLTNSGGQWLMFAGVARATSSYGITPGDLRGAMVLQTRVPQREAFNGVRGTIPDATRYGQTTSFPPVKNSNYIEDDGGEIWRDIDLPCTTSPKRAQRIAKIHLEKGRQQIVVRAALNWSGLRHAVGDIVPVSNPALGWSEKLFDVIDWTLAEGGGVDVTMQEYAAAAYDWADGDETTIDPAPDTDLPDWSDVSAPGLTLRDDFIEQGGGLMNRLLLDISLPADEFVSRFDVEFREEGAADWVPVSGNITQILGVEDLQTYEVRVRSVNTLGAPSEWVTATHQVVGQSAAPADVTGFVVNIIGAHAHLSWDPVPDLDLSHYRLRYTPSPSETVWGNAADLVERIGRPATSVQVPALVGTFLLKAVDFRGIPSVNPAVSSSTIAAIEGLNVVQVLTEDPDFDGTHDGTTVAAGTLRLAGGIAWDEMGAGVSPTLLWDDAPGLWDMSGGAGVGTSGYYTFGPIDLGDVYTSRVTARLVVAGVDLSEVWDERAALWDSWPGLWDGEVPSTVNVGLQIALSDSNPAASPDGFGAWRPFVVGDFTARGLLFRAHLESTEPNLTPAVSELSMTVDMPDRVEPIADRASDPAGTAVIYPVPFKATPALGLVVKNLATGDYWTVTAESATGFTFRAFNAAGAGITRNFSGVAKGYGRAL